MAKVSDIFGTGPRLKFNQFDFRTLTLEKIWSDYDELTDSIVCYFTGKLVRAISVHLQDGFHVMVDPVNKDVVGIHIEYLEKFFLPEHPILQTSWPYVKQSFSDESSSMLRLFSFGLASLVQEIGNTSGVDSECLTDSSTVETDKGWDTFLSLTDDAEPGQLENPSLDHDKYLYEIQMRTPHHEINEA